VTSTIKSIRVVLNVAALALATLIVAAATHMGPMGDDRRAAYLAQDPGGLLAETAGERSALR